MLQIRNSTSAVKFASLAGPLILAFLIRVFLCFGTNSISWYQADTNDYSQQADAIKQGTWINIFPNGYPVIIAFLSSVFHPVELDVLLIWANIIMSTAVVGLIYYITFKRTQKWGLAGFAALVGAIWPNQLNYVPQLITEVSAAFFLVAGLVFASVKKPLSSGLLLGFAATVRTSLLPVSPLMSVFLVCKR